MRARVYRDDFGSGTSYLLAKIANFLCFSRKDDVREQESIINATNTPFLYKRFLQLRRAGIRTPRFTLLRRTSNKFGRVLEYKDRNTNFTTYVQYIFKRDEFKVYVNQGRVGYIKRKTRKLAAEYKLYATGDRANESGLARISTAAASACGTTRGVVKVVQDREGDLFVLSVKGT